MPVLNGTPSRDFILTNCEVTFPTARRVASERRQRSSWSFPCGSHGSCLRPLGLNLESFGPVFTPSSHARRLTVLLEAYGNKLHELATSRLRWPVARSRLRSRAVDCDVVDLAARRTSC